MDEANIMSRIAMLETQVKALDVRIGKIDTLLEKVTEVCVKLDALIRSQEDLTSRLTALEKEPVDRWQLVTRTVITAVVTAALTYLGSRLLGK